VHQQKDGILAQKMASPERKLRLRGLLFLSSIPLFGIVTAFGIAPQTELQNIPITTVVEQLELPKSAIAGNETEVLPLWQVDTVRRDDTLDTVLERLNIRNDSAIAFLKQDSEASTLATRLRPGRSILAQTTPEGELLELQYEYEAGSSLMVTRYAEGYRAEHSAVVLENQSQLKSATINSSLFAATDSADIPDSIALQLVDIFSSHIDFHQDLRKGDHFTVVYEAGFSNGGLSKPGKVLAAEFVNQNKTYQAVLYRDTGGKEAYYTPEGKGLNLAFLRSPLEFSRISSGFTLARYHPVLKKWRAHKGVDYAAPTGTRIKATANGTVAFVGNKGGYGNAVILQHQNGISTLYGHLSRFATGLRKGQKIAQGEIIGQVGSTGLASGPHLHYEFLVHGQHKDPLKVAMPRSETLSPAALALFKRQTQAWLAQLDLMRSYQTAALE
jgi:murein DD-endopeptidase MepM/ murein hydrolase activator NlpD